MLKRLRQEDCLSLKSAWATQTLSRNRVAGVGGRRQKYISKHFTSLSSAHNGCPTNSDTLNDFSYGARDGPTALPMPGHAPPHLTLPDALFGSLVLFS